MHATPIDIPAAALSRAAASRQRAGVRALLSTNAKTVKGDHGDKVVRIMNLPPHMHGGRVFCSHSTEGCAAACLADSGHAAIGDRATNPVVIARELRGEWLIADEPAFMVWLCHELNGLIRRADVGATVAVRLNGTSDLPWHRMPFSIGGTRYPSIMAAYPGVQFYDYSKVPTFAGFPENYRRTFSLSENNDRQALAALARGLNVAVVMAVKKGHPLPTHWGGYPVIDGDTDDFRWLDPAGGHIVGLRPKGIPITRTAVGGFMRDPFAGFELDRVPVTAHAARLIAAAAD